MEDAAKDKADNRSTQDCWKNYSIHRAHVTNLLVSLGKLRNQQADGQAGSLCLLGAGNLNDVELKTLLNEFHSIHLIDIDSEAVLSGIARQVKIFPQVSDALNQRRIISYPPIDLSDIASLLSNAPTLSGLDARREIVRKLTGSFTTHESVENTSSGYAILKRLNGKFEVVASLCLVSQLIRQLQDRFGERQDWLPIANLIRDHHIRLINTLLAPGGMGLLVTDIAGTKTGTATLNSVEASDADATNRLAAHLVAEQKHYPFLAPQEVENFLRENLHAIDITTSKFWLWDINLNARYLCYGIRWQRRSSPVSKTAKDALMERINSFMQRTGLAVTSFEDQNRHDS